MNNTQSANVVKLLAYLRKCVGTDMASKYNHRSFTRCTIGFAAHSGLFPTLNITTRPIAGSTCGWSIHYARDINHHIASCFGEDYLLEVASGNKSITDYEAGEEQLKAAISEIEKFLTRYNIAIPPAVKAKAKVKPNPDTAGKRIEARIARMEKIVADIEKLGADAKHFTVNHTSMQAQIATLKDALAS